MILPLVCSAPEVRGLLDGTLTEIRRPIEGLPPEPTNVRYLHGAYLKCDAPPGAGVSLRLPCPWGPGWTGPDYERFAEVLFVQEAWQSWERTCEEEGDHDYDDDWQNGRSHCTEHCHQTYVAYQATPHLGYRPAPDRAAITWGVSAEDMDSWHRRRLAESPWQPAQTMPVAYSRLALRNRGVRAERIDGVWQWVVTVEVITRPNGAPVPPAEIGGADAA